MTRMSTSESVVMDSIAVHRNDSINTSQQELVCNTSDKSSLKSINCIENASDADDSSSHVLGLAQVTRKQWIIVAILCFINLINYMDRYTIAAVKNQIEVYYNITDVQSSFLQTIFIISYMFFAPIFGYLGDRYNRTYLMTFGIFIWSLTTFLGSFASTYYQFMFFRCLVGVGEASYSTIAPTIISDLFVKELRSKMLALFYFAIPVGFGLGFIVGKEAAFLAGSWHYSLRVTPFLGVLAILLICFYIKDPERGYAEGGSLHLRTTNWTTDLNELLHNKSFLLSTLGFTCVSFVSGALSWNVDKFLSLGMEKISGRKVETEKVTIIFGTIATLTGIFGVALGTLSAQYYRKKYENSDPLICAIGLLLAAPTLYIALFLNGISTTWCLVFVFFAQLFLNLNWAIVADILLYVVVPNKRSFAESFQILVSHALGDAISPVVVAFLKTFVKTYLSGDNVVLDELTSEQYALFSTCFVTILGSFLFFWNASFIVEDRKKVEVFVAAQSERHRNT